MDETYKRLIADFPKEAYSKDGSRGFDLTSLKAQYGKERLNEVFGVFGWEFVEEFEKTEKNIIEIIKPNKPPVKINVPEGVLCHGKLTIKKADTQRIIHATGWSQAKKNVGDSFKGASTDALSKACSFIGIGNEVFKGNVNLNTMQDVSYAKGSATNTAPVKPKSLFKADIYGICVHCDGWMHLSKSGKSIYCENYKDKSKQHAYSDYENQVPLPEKMRDGDKEEARKWFAQIKRGANPLNEIPMGTIPF